MSKEDERIAALVQGTADELGNKLYELQVPVDIGMAAISMLLATACRAKGISEYDAIYRFATSIKQVYKQIPAPTSDERPNH